ncbi:FRG domain-containing protein [Flavobacterium psychrophilum]|uniref:FRG domain-containing protein n=1 Tax=Flavobacterium psychrophilum TaxID=96345 RepID=UPI001C8F6DEA|nr:FRG domain-containing protein [Flavobacterium psychrophilum]EKT4499091.1 FRG domain-containing protein [Flavobacterium psychrophilum]ELY1992138.1 FRG domain-containing protein [Flavobacterium psychrophilum]QZK97549.1 FRG domain-containing protein [Flavobacterium psychrophilum]
MEIKTIDDFYDFLKKYTETKDNLIYRGVRNSTFELIPSIGRLKTKKDNNLTVEEEIRLLDIFKHRAHTFLKDYKEDNLELLTIGQHHGLPTRILDWTKNPLVATYFAVEKQFTKEDEKKTNFSCIYIYDAKTKVKLSRVFNPFNIDKVERYVPKHWDKRIVSQSGLFTVHNAPYEPWNPESLEKILIHKDVRKKIKVTLNRFGINSGLIYPDINGISEHIKWLRSNEH